MTGTTLDSIADRYLVNGAGQGTLNNYPLAAIAEPQ